MPRIIEVMVSPRVEATVRTKGYLGGEYTAASKFLEQALGIAVSDVRTAEFHQVQPAGQALTQTQ